MMRISYFFLMSGFMCALPYMYGEVQGQLSQDEIDAIVQDIAPALASVQTLPRPDITPALDELKRHNARQPALPVGSVMTMPGLTFSQEYEHQIITPQVLGPVFALPATENELKNIPNHQDGQWYTIVPQRVIVPGFDERVVEDNPLRRVVADEANREELEAWRARDCLFDKSSFQLVNNSTVTMLDPVVDDVQNGYEYYIKDGDAYVAAPKEIKKLFDDGTRFEPTGNYFQRSDQKIIPHNRLDFAVGTYPHFYKKLALLGGEVVANSLMYSLFKKARLRYIVKTLIAQAPHIVGGSITLKALEGKLRFMPFNPFHVRALPYLAAYMVISEIALFARKKIPDVSYIESALKKAYRLVALQDLPSSSFSPEYVTGVPIQLYPIVEFLSTGRIGLLEKLGESGSAATLAYAGLTSSWKKTALDLIRRFLIVYFTLQKIDKDSTKKLMRVVGKDKGTLFALLQDVVDKKSPDAERALAEYVEKQSALRQRSLLSSVLNNGKAKKLSQKLIDAQILFRYRLKAAFFVNTIWTLPLLARAVFVLVKNGIPFAQSLMGT